MDFFGSIAAKGIGGRHELLAKNEPPKFEKRETEFFVKNAFNGGRYAMNG